MKPETTQHKNVRPPVVVIMGHIDHGKSTLLDYIRSTNIVDKEAGGITQHLSAYVVSAQDGEGATRTITFLDTPGHEAFSAMRSRGARSADIAILVVSAEDSVKAQTLEAYKTIQEAGLPYIVAINKIDKPNANPEKVKLDLAEHGIYLEGYGGDIPSALISAKQGTGVAHLLELVLLVADLEGFAGDPAARATGVIIESHLDPRRGISATLIVRNGTLKHGMFITSGSAIAGTRIMEDFRGKAFTEAHLSDPVGIVGWSQMPEVGGEFYAHESKKEAEKAVEELTTLKKDTNTDDAHGDIKKVPLIIRTDTRGTADAVLMLARKLEQPTVAWKVLSCDVGSIGESDLKMAAVDPDTVIVGFNTKIDARARELNEQLHIPVQTFDIIYKLSDYLGEVIEERRPRVETLVTAGVLKVQKTFSRTKDRQVVGGLVLSGEINVGNEVRILRREAEIGRGTFVGLEQNKTKTKTVAEGLHCGALVESRIEIAPGDLVEAITRKVE
jgi:translation initiation factor IF-2